MKLNFADGFRNLLAGLGMVKDRTMYQNPALRELSGDDLIKLYRGDWLSRKIVDIPAFDMTRAWRAWTADQDQIEALEETEKNFGIQHKTMRAITLARLMGGSGLVLGVAGTGNWTDPLSLDDVKKDSLKFVHCVIGGRAQRLAAGPIVQDISSPWFGHPSYYMRSNRLTPPAPANIDLGVDLIKGLGKLQEMAGAGTIYIHPSRVIRFIGAEYPDQETSPDGWGDSVLQIVYDAIRDAGLVGQSIANLVAKSHVDVIKHPGLTAAMQTDAGTQRVTNRFANANAAQSIINAILLDKDEEWDTKSVQFAGLTDIMNNYFTVAAAAADIPSTRFMSREPAGMNATGESDMRNYYDRLSSEQSVDIQPRMSTLDEIIIRSTFGTRDKDIYYKWNPLWQMTDAQKADIAFKKAQAFQIDVNSSLINSDALRESRISQLIEDGTYPGLEQAIEDFGSEPDEDDLMQQMGMLGMMQKPGLPKPANDDDTDTGDDDSGNNKPQTDPDQQRRGIKDAELNGFRRVASGGRHVAIPFRK